MNESFTNSALTSFEKYSKKKKLDYCHDFRQETAKQVITFWLILMITKTIFFWMTCTGESYTIRPETYMYKTIVSFDFLTSMSITTSWVSRHKVILRQTQRWTRYCKALWFDKNTHCLTVILSVSLFRCRGGWWVRSCREVLQVHLNKLECRGKVHLFQ